MPIRRPKEVEGFKEWCENRGENNWKLKIGKKEYIGEDWEVTSKFGKVEAAVVVDEKGRPIFDRPAYSEASNVNIVAWGRDPQTGEVKIAVLHQPRPHADDPEGGSNDVVFGQIPMGFLEKLIGKKEMEKFEDAAKREVAEEAGGTVVLNITRPKYPYHNPNPTFVRTWSDLFFVEVDLNEIQELKKDRSEPIFKAEYIPVKELIRRVREGKVDNVVYRMCTSNSLWFIFFCTYPELWPREI